MRKWSWSISLYCLWQCALAMKPFIYQGRGATESKIRRCVKSEYLHTLALFKKLYFNSSHPYHMQSTTQIKWKIRQLSTWFYRLCQSDVSLLVRMVGRSFIFQWYIILYFPMIDHLYFPMIDHPTRRLTPSFILFDRSKIWSVK